MDLSFIILIFQTYGIISDSSLLAVFLVKGKPRVVTGQPLASAGL